MVDIANLKPQTLEGIKRLAKQIKKRDNIQHAEALEKAAQQTGYSNYPHAHKELSK